MGRSFLRYVEAQSSSRNLLFSSVLAVVLGVLDLVTGYELSFSVFFVIPVGLAAWSVSGIAGLGMSLFSAILWYFADTISGHPYSHSFIPVWNSGIRFTYFAIITMLLSALRRALEHERELARIDSLTGAVNARSFLEAVQVEMARERRYGRPFTLAYVDLDNFKAVNDRCGHLVGDQALRAVVRCARAHLREVDVVARLGGDEFALLLPETDRESAQAALTKIQGSLLDEMRKNGWPVTFSIGVVTCGSVRCAADELVKMADDLMYTVKRGGKNAIQYTTRAD